MWILPLRAPAPDVPYWPGRRWLAALDAVGWPLLLICIAQQSTIAGLIGALAQAICALIALRRLHIAIGRNERYRFTTWRWGRALAALWVIGLLLKWALAS